MYGKFANFILLSIAFSACKPLNEQQPACATKVCTKEFRTVSIKFLDKDGTQISVENYKATDMRTSIVLHDNSVILPGAYPPYYNVADDSDLSKLSDEGDNIEVSGKNSVTGQTMSAVVKVSGGCNCHVEKVSGVEQIQFN